MAGAQADDGHEKASELAWVYRRIRTMSLIDRSLVLLYLDGNGYQEIAEILGISGLVQWEGGKFEKRFRFRDWFELGGGILLGSFFIFIAVFILPQDEGGTWRDQWHWMLLGLACLFIAFLFVRLRLASQAFKPEAQVPYTIFCALTFTAIILGNRWYARRKLQPQLESMNRLIEETNES
jgi:hypothetical protein